MNLSINSNYKFNLFSKFYISRCYFSKWYTPPTKEIFHPYINEPEQLPLNSPYKSARLKKSQMFIPKNYSRDITLERLRSGQNLGSDYPWNLLQTNSNYKFRLYNVKQESIPWMISEVKGIEYYKRLHVFGVNWMEDGIHRIRWFRCAHGIMRAKKAAERFKLKLEAAGRVDNMKTERQKRMDVIRKNTAAKLRQKRYAKITRGLM